MNATFEDYRPFSVAIEGRHSGALIVFEKWNNDSLWLKNLPKKEAHSL